MGSNIPYLEDTSLWQRMEAAAEVRQFGAHQVVFERGTAAQGVHVVKSGRVAIGRTVAHHLAPHSGRSGGHIPVEVADPGALLGLGEAITGGSHLWTAESLGSVEIAYVSRSRLLELLVMSPTCCNYICRALSQKIGEVQNRHRLLGGPGVRTCGRVNRVG